MQTFLIPKVPKSFTSNEAERCVILEGDKAGGLAVDMMLEQVYNGQSHLCKLFANDLVESEE
jgi:hypothetical protein